MFAARLLPSISLLPTLCPCSYSGEGEEYLTVDSQQSASARSPLRAPSDWIPSQQKGTAGWTARSCIHLCPYLQNRNLFVLPPQRVAGCFHLILLSSCSIPCTPWSRLLRREDWPSWTDRTTGTSSRTEGPAPLPQPPR